MKLKKKEKNKYWVSEVIFTIIIFPFLCILCLLLEKGRYLTHSYDCWFIVLRINVYLVIFQPYLDLEAGDNRSLKIQVARPGIEPRSSCSASQELNHSTTTAPHSYDKRPYTDRKIQKAMWQHKSATKNFNYTQCFRTDLGRSVEVTITTQLVWLN